MFNQTQSTNNGQFETASSIDYQNYAPQTHEREGENMREYALKMTQRIWAMYSPNSTLMTQQFDRCELYARGQQDMSKYKRYKGIHKLGQSISSVDIMQSVDRSIGLGDGSDGDFLRYKGLSSIIEAAQGRVVPMKRDIIITANDKKALEQKAANKNKIIAGNYIKNNLPPETLQYSDTSGQQPVEEKPLPIEETETRAVNMVLNNIGTIWREVEEYLSWTQLVQGIAGVKIDVTPTYSISYRPIDVTRLVMPTPTQNDCKDLKCIGEIIMLSVADLKALDTEKNYTDADWAACPATRNAGVYTDSGVTWDRLVNVLDVEWTDVKKNGKGDTLCVYRGKFVIGTKIVVDYGEKEFQVRPSFASGKFNEMSDFSFILQSPYISAKAMLLNSLVSRALPEIDVAQACKVNFMKELVNARPTFYTFTEATFRLVDNFFNNTLDKTNNDERMSDPFVLLDMLEKSLMIMPDPEETGTGNIIKPEPPFRTEGGLPQAAMDYLIAGKQAIDNVREIMGLPNGVVAAMPDPNQSVTAQRNAIAAAEAVLLKIGNANEAIFRRVANHIAMVVPQIMWDLKNGVIGYSSLAALFTDKEQDILSNIHEIYNHNFTFTVNAAPTQSQMVQFESKVELAVQSGTITGPQSIRFIRQAVNDFETALASLEEAEEQNTKLKHDQQMQIQKANADGNAEAARLAAEGTINNTIAEGKNEISKVNAQLQADLIMMKEKHRLEMEQLKEAQLLKTLHEVTVMDNTPTKPQPK